MKPMQRAAKQMQVRSSDDECEFCLKVSSIMHQIYNNAASCQKTMDEG